MESKITFGKWEATTLLINMLCSKIILNFPRVVAEVAGPASWILVAYISIITFLLFFIITKLYSRFEGKDLMDIGEQVGGNVGRIIIGVIILVFLISITSIVLREFSEDMKTVALTMSPISFVEMFFLTGMIVGAYFGIEAIVRFHAFIVPILAIGFLVIIIAVIPLGDYTNLFPVLGTGAFNIFAKGFFKMSIFSELLIIFLLVPFIKTNKNLKKIGYASLGVSAFLLIISAPVFIMTVNYPNGLESFLPIFQMARLINYGRFFQRVESLFVLIWAASGLLYLSASFFFIVYVFKKTFKLQYIRPLIIPFAVIIYTVSLLPENLITAVKLETEFFRNISWVVTFGVTILLLLIGVLFKKKVSKGVKR